LLTTVNTSTVPYQPLSLHPLPLPTLEADRKPSEYLVQRRGSDPLLEFYVDKQKIEEAAKSIKLLDLEPHVGLNLVKELAAENDEGETAVRKPQIKKVPKTNEPETIHEAPLPEEESKVCQPEEPQVETTVLESTPTPIEEIAQPIPICEDPASKQWYPLPVVCQIFRSQGRIYDLESLLWGTHGIRADDRKCIYLWTLQAYADAGMFPQAVDLTRRLELEGLSEDFPEYHSLMSNFAMTVYYQQQMPGTFTDQSEISSLTGDRATSAAPSIGNLEVEEPARNYSQALRKLKKAIGNKDTEACLKHYNVLERGGVGHLNVTESSTLIELFVKADHITEALEVTELMLSREAYPLPRVFRFLLNRLAALGEVEAMTRIGACITPKIKKEVSFDNRLCNGYLAAGRAKEYLNMLIDELEAATDINEEKLQCLKDKFPRGGAMGLLESDSTLAEPFTKLALKFVDLGYVAPVNVLWTYHFINGRHDLAKPLWDAYVRTCPQIMFQKVCQTARSTSNVDLAERLVKLLEDAVVTNGARGIAYSCLLDVLTQKKDYSRGLESLGEALNSGIRIEDINRTALKRLKEGLELLGAGFPFEIPQKSLSGSVINETEENSSIRSATPSLS